jgi:anti-sigma regulatory factor (Ser/Thr protein kinase)
VRITRLLSRTLLEDLGALPGDVDDIEVIVSELCTNVVRHAHSDTGRYQVGLEYYPGKVVITVEDTGGGFSPAMVSPPGTGRADPEVQGGERIGGFGLPLIRAISDRLDFHATRSTERVERAELPGLTVRAEKAFGYQNGGVRARVEGMDEGEQR